MTLVLAAPRAHGARRPATWFEELFWGRRQVLTTGFGDLGSPVLGLFALYYERRDRVVRLGPRVLAASSRTSATPITCKIEEIAPATAVRRQSRVRAGGEVVALHARSRRRTSPPRA